MKMIKIREEEEARWIPLQKAQIDPKEVNTKTIFSTTEQKKTILEKVQDNINNPQFKKAKQTVNLLLTTLSFSSQIYSWIKESVTYLP